MTTSIHALDKEQVIQILQDKTLSTIPCLRMNDKPIANTTFTIFFNKNGQAIAKLSRPIEKVPQTDHGTWEVNANGSLCTKWQHWQNQKPDCTLVFDLKNSLLFVNAETGVFDTIVFKDMIKEGNHVMKEN